MTCYVATTNNGGELTPEARTLPGWSGANQIPLTVNPGASSVSVTFNPIGANMSCQLVYRDTDGAIHYSDPVASGVCTLPVANVRNNVVVAVVCNTDYIYEGEQTRTAKFDYRLTMGSGTTGTADIHTKWWDYNPDTYTIAASAGANGSIHPSGAVVVNNGAVQTFTFAPAPGYKVGDVLLNGLTVGAPTSYTLNPVLSDNSLQVVFRDAVPPSAPIGLSASVVNGSIHIDWADNSEPDLATYNVYRATTGGGEYSPIARGVSASTFTDHVVVDGTTYHYVISAVDAESNESVFSAEVPATAIDTLAPAAPAGLVVEGTGATAFLNWADNGEPDLAGYTVLRSSTSGGGYAVIASGLTSSDYVDASVTPGATYFYVVTAGDLSGNQSGNSAETTVVSKVLARWDFNDPSLGAANGATVPSSSTFPTYIWRVAAYDKSGKGNDITTSGGNSSFNWSSNSQDGDFSIKSAGTTPSAFTRSDRSGVSVANDVEKFNGAAFTVEAVATISGDNTFRTVVGREARYLSTLDPNFGSLYLGLDGENRARFLYVDVNGKYIELKSSSTYAADDNLFHHFAASTDGSTVSLHVDGVLVAQTTGAGMAGLGIGDSGFGYRPGAWCIGRGLYAGGGSDRWHGFIDSVSITGLALEPGTFVLSNDGPIDAAPAAPSGLTATPGDGIVALDWANNIESDLAGYTVYRSTTPGSGYAPIRVGLTTSAYTDP
ncbi:MAG: hypothetical protein KDN05_14005, partial [Verrucomicrobiae bacterium]|nr:hypothetical protein [Verrucomicrobiae bacterium]